jgi:hypothetical protein
VIDQWIQLDFRDMKVKPTHYAIQNQKDRTAPQTWFMEVPSGRPSDPWTVIDVQMKNQALRAFAPAVFEIANGPWCRLMRFRQTPPSAHDAGWLNIARFEIFGEVALPTAT